MAEAKELPLHLVIVNGVATVMYIVEYINKGQQRARENSCIQVYLTSMHVNDLICD